jgi:hypothetical protein
MGVFYGILLPVFKYLFVADSSQEISIYSYGNNRKMLWALISDTFFYYKTIIANKIAMMVLRQESD